MGVATSKNIANAIENVVNTIQNSSTASSDQQNKCSQSFRARNCVFKGAFDVKTTCQVAMTSKNISDQLSENQLQSTIAQNLLQEAKSAVGAAGLGYADANNTINAMINSTNNISSIVQSISKQNHSSAFNFDCDHSVFDGDVSFGISSVSNFLSDQVAEQKSFNNLVSNVSQSISQKATSEISGLAGLILAIAVLLVAIGYVVFKPAGMLLSNKYIMVTVISLILVSIGVFLYLQSLPPLFNPPTQCVGGGSCGSNLGGTPIDCVDYTSSTSKITSPPPRYSYDIVGYDGTIPTLYGGGGSNPGLLQLLISNNGGWAKPTPKMTTQWPSLLTNYPLDGKVPPSPLTFNGSSYITNYTEWSAYASSSPYLARFILCDLLGMDTSIYVDPTELCNIGGKIGVASSFGSVAYKFTPDSKTDPSRAYSGGVVEGNFGKCNNGSYKLQKVMNPWGYIGLSIVMVGIIVFLILYNRRSE